MGGKVSYDNRHCQGTPRQWYKTHKIDGIVAEVYVQQIDNIEIWDRQQQKDDTMPEKPPFILRESQLHKKIKYEKYTYPKLEFHICPVSEKFHLVERINGDPYNKYHRQQ